MSGGSVEPYTTTKGRLWMVRYRDENNRQRKRKGFTTKRDATLALADLQVKLARGEWIDPNASKVTVGVLAVPWLEGTTHLKATTRNNLESTLNVHVLPHWKDREVGTIRPTMVRAWVSAKVADGVGATVLERALGILRQILAQAVEDRRLPSNPCDNVRVPRREHSPRGYLTHQQVEALAVECGRDATFVRFLAYTGLRWGEMAALRVSDFDMLRRRVQVTRAVAEVRGEVVVSTPKTREKRSVPFPAFLADELAERMTGRGREALVFSSDGSTFTRVSNWRPRVFNKAVRRCQLAAEVQRRKEARAGDPTTPEFPRISVHDLRHTAASLAISAGANVKAVQTMLGHASAAMTLDTYADLFPDDLEAVAGALDAARSAACAPAVPSTQQA
ncbi:tyrosine-type recombinase/integrase [Dietzia natronolimnaea]|uniref:tyrosine-type recombinase/integrase n=1 Tax=Dietzia natronolimnaea TaxID=161920 RepID=UPI0015F8EEC3|nr:tyrosine-type recombinase/integrase [Dietzia natronolimnaea]MBB1036719.1 site-specific integrase [Dietzia natronolimnaea]